MSTMTDVDDSLKLRVEEEEVVINGRYVGKRLVGKERLHYRPYTPGTHGTKTASPFSGDRLTQTYR